MYKVFFRSQIVPLRCCTTVVSCAFTTYVYYLSTPNDASCFCLSEVERWRGSNEIEACIYDWIRQLSSMVFKVPLFSDLAVAEIATKMWLQCFLMRYISSSNHAKLSKVVTFTWNVFLFILQLSVRRGTRMSSLCCTECRYFVRLDEKHHTKFSIITIKTSLASKTC